MIIIAIWGPRAPAIGYQCVYHVYNYIIKHVVEVIDLILIKIYLVKSCWRVNINFQKVMHERLWDHILETVLGCWM